MPNLIVRHYNQTRVGGAGEATLQLTEPAASGEVVAFGSLSAAFAYEWIQVQADAKFKIAFGTAPTAGAATDFTYPVGAVFTFAVRRGDKLHVIAA